MAVTRQPKRTRTTKVKDPAPLVAPADQPIPAQPAPRPKDAPRTMKELRLAHAGKRSARAKPVENVLREGLRLARIPDPCVLVLFGSTGDLAHRKVLPALYHLWRTDLLPHEFRVLAIGRLALVRRADLVPAPGLRGGDGLRRPRDRARCDGRGAWDSRQSAVLPRHPAVAVRRHRDPAGS